ncbi:MAG: LLM class flavin-dependent oxidoreductase [Hyphomicrobiales bacterium]
MNSGRLNFGIFMAPFHPVGENPTLALQRDLELIEWLDHLGFDEAWIGEHHSAGWEIISSPEVFIGVAAERTRHIRLGTGVVSLPYHNPYMTAERMTLLDHLTRGRVMLGVGPGALYTDSHQLGLEPTRQREMMDEALGVILRLLTEDEPFTFENDWIRLRDARLQLRPYQQPHMPVFVASQVSPAGMQAAGKYGVGALSLGTAMGGVATIPGQWAIAEAEAAKHGKTIDRRNWRLMLPIYIAEDREEAFADIAKKGREWAEEYFAKTLGRPMAMQGDDDIAAWKATVADGGAIIGTPEDAIAAIERLDELSGGFGGVLGLAHEWAPREKIHRSYELLARYVIPRFQGTLTGLEKANAWARERATEMFGRETAAIQAAFAKHAGGR